MAQRPETQGRYRLIIIDRAGVEKDYADSAYSIRLSIQRADSPSTLTGVIKKTPIADFHEGNQIQFYVDGEKQFSGFIFSKEKDHLGNITFLAYDQIRYLEANQSFTIEGEEVGDVIRRVADLLGLKVGEIATTNYALPLYLYENQSCYDIISDCLAKTIVATNEIYTFYDDNGYLTLTNANDMILPNVVLGDGSLVYDYLYKTDIDSDTYNRIKLAKPNSETGGADIYQFESSYTIGLWGTLQYYDVVDENLNDAQLIEYGELLLTYYNRVLRTLELNAVGIPGLRAGHTVLVTIKELGDISLNNYVMLESVEHSYAGGGDHTMNLTCRIIAQEGGIG